MTEKVLFVDDDPNILSAYQRQQRKQFTLDTVISGMEGLRCIEQNGPYAVVVSDLRMPGMDGIEFLTKVKDRSPETVRVMLTGNADITAAISSVNEGRIFRFLTKPCLPEDLARALQSSIEQYRLVSAERELLHNTLSGSVRVLIDILSIVDQESFGGAETLRDSIRTIANALGMQSSWELELAAMLSQIGQVTVPPGILIKERSSLPLSNVEKEIISRVPQVGHKLLAKIPRMESVARIVLYQNKCFDGSGLPKDKVAGAEIPTGARLLKIVMDMLHAESGGLSRMESLELLKSRKGWYDPTILDTAFLCFARSEIPQPELKQAVYKVGVKDLRVGQILVSDIFTSNGTLLIKGGIGISETTLQRIRNFAMLNGVLEPIQIETTPIPELNLDNTAFG
jgi:response regulator RpfG family c-di-GMP phosphodiesterase